MKNFTEGWYYFNKATAHYFETPGNPICNRKLRGTSETWRVTTQEVSPIKKEKMSKVLGGCKSCLNKMKQPA